MLPPPEQWLFITGCQRSGTTLLRLLLECHPAVFCFDEIDAYRVLSSRFYEQDIAQPIVAFKVPRWAEQLDAERLWDFGLEQEADRIYFGQKILFLVRDYRDTIASMLKLKWEKSWLEHWAAPIIDAKLQRDSSFQDRWSEEIQLCRNERATLAATGALYWKYKTEALLRYKERGYPVLGISYERLVADPEGQLKRICRFLGLEFSDSMLHHPDHAHRELYANGLTLGNTDPARPIDAGSVSQWPQWFSGDAVATAAAVVGELPALAASHCD